MEIILKKDVENLGFADDIVEVKNGYGRNFLIPQRYAVLATASAKKVLAENLKQRAFKEQKVIAEAKEVAEKIAALEIKIPAKVGVGNKLFGSITSADLVQVLSKEGVTIDKKFISIPGNNIKRTGVYTASIRLHRTLITSLTFEVLAQ